MQPRFRQLFIIFLLLIGLVWIFLSRVESNANDTLVAAPQIGFLAPDFSLPSLDGTTITLSDFRGKAVILNFWASWCPPCKAEMPALEVVHNSDPGSMSILAINTTYQDSLQNVEIFIEENKITFPILLEVDNSVNKLYQVNALPTTFFIDSSGLIRDIVIGGALTESGIRTRIETLNNRNP